MELQYRVVTVRNSKGKIKKDPGVHYRELTAEFGNPCYTRIDAFTSPEQKQKLQKLSLDSVKESELGGELILAKLTKARGNNAPIGGLEVVVKSDSSRRGPRVLENMHKIYAERFKGESHLNAIVSEARRIVINVLGKS